MVELELSKKAREELRAILIKDVGFKIANSFSDKELNKLGLLFLTILMEDLKIKVGN